MPSKERNPWEANNETKVVFFSRTVCTKLHFYVIFKAICHFLGTTSSLSFSNKKKKEGHNDLYITALTMPRAGRSRCVSHLIMDISFSYPSWRNWKVHSHYPKDFCSSSQLVHQRIFVFARSEQLYVHCFIAYRGVYIIHNSIWYRTCIKFPHYKNGETGAQWLAFNHADYQCYRIQQLLKRIIQLVAEWN